MMYSDIIDLPRPEPKHPRLPMSARAAQFSPFAALSGYEDAIAETGRLTERRPSLEDDMKRILDERLRLILLALDERPCVSIWYFVSDERKDGGSLRHIEGVIRRYDPHGFILLEGGERIPLNDIVNIESPSLASMV